MTARNLLTAAAVLALAACGEAAAPAAGDAAPAVGEATPESAPAAPAVETAPYTGLYGDAADPGELFGQFLVMQAAPPPMADRFPELPPGYLMIGAVWADTAPWYMKPVTATRYEQDFLSSFDPEPVVIEFSLDAEGRATGFAFVSGMTDFGPRDRLADAPEP